MPDRRLITVPLPVMAAIDRIFMGGKLAPNLQIMRLLARVGEHSDPAPANELLGAPTTTVSACSRHAWPPSPEPGSETTRASRPRQPAAPGLQRSREAEHRLAALAVAGQRE